jgi:hypothetical protein
MRRPRFKFTNAAGGTTFINLDQITSIVFKRDGCAYIYYMLNAEDSMRLLETLEDFADGRTD